MFKNLLRFLINGLAVFLSGYFLPGVTVDDYWAALLTSLVLGLLNLFIKPILTFLSLPITILTFGLFAIVIDTAVVLLTAYLVPGFAIADFLSGLFFVLLLTVLTYVLNTILGTD